MRFELGEGKNEYEIFYFFARLLFGLMSWQLFCG